jgi:hypothetical protein
LFIFFYQGTTNIAQTKDDIVLFFFYQGTTTGPGDAGRGGLLLSLLPSILVWFGAICEFSGLVMLGGVGCFCLCYLPFWFGLGQFEFSVW